MKNKTVFALIILAITIPLASFGQIIDFQKRSISNVKEYEEKFNSIIVDTVEDFGILKKPHINVKKLIQTQALIYKRSEDNFDPQLHIWYYYDHKKNNNKGILYNWGLYNPGFNPSKNTERIKKLSKKEKVFQIKFADLEKEIHQQLGEPIKQRVLADNKKYYTEEIFWEDETKIVGLSMNFYRKIEEIPGIGIFAKYSIQVMITYK